VKIVGIVFPVLFSLLFLRLGRLLILEFLNFGALRNWRQSVKCKVEQVRCCKPIKDETLMNNFHARLHNGKAKVLLSHETDFSVEKNLSFSYRDRYVRF